jgi:hypothetical protein
MFMMVADEGVEINICPSRCPPDVHKTEFGNRLYAASVM